MEVKNAVIESVTLEKGDRGFLQCWLHLSYGGAGQGFGGYVLYLPKSYSHHELKSIAGHFIFRCMEIAGVDRWEHLPGRTIRVRSDLGKVHSIGHIVKDDWFDPAEDFSAKADAGDESEALRDMLDSARSDLEVIREALGVPVEPHQSLMERMAEAAQAKRGRVPEGWKLVPVEPTLEMIDAYLQNNPRFYSAKDDWAAMLAAAPAAPDHSAAKCDGNHAGPRCADPECWNDPIDDVIDVRTAAERLIKRALAVGVVLTIKTQPRQPLAMGNFDLVVETREARKGGAA
ncbi:MAG: hypothetical protein GY844_05975 [Bradyrhizobium sp.]|nr:hypothetical protein [Bradyrhizobium sp.]